MRKKIDKVISNLNRKRLRDWIDRLTFPHILIVWFSVILLFGLFYYFFADESSHLFYVHEGASIQEIRDAIYFSFVTATTTGFGDIIPLGFFKFIAILEVVFGLLLLAIVTSKLVSIKQNAILTEVYNISFKEKINRLRSSLLLFRQNLDRLMSKLEEGNLRHRDINALTVYISSFEDALHETSALIDTDLHNEFIKNLGPVNTELIFNSILHSLEKLHETIQSFEEHKVEWRDGTFEHIKRCIDFVERLFSILSSSKSLPKEIIQDLYSRKNAILSLLKNE